MSSENNDLLNCLFECGICLKVSNIHLRVQPCGHSYCGECLQTIAAQGDIERRICPTCRAPMPAKFDVSQCPFNYQLSSAKDNIKTIMDKLSKVELIMRDQGNEIRSLRENMKELVQTKVNEAMAIERMQYEKKIKQLNNLVTRLRNELEDKDDQVTKSQQSRQIAEAELADAKRELENALKGWWQRLLEWLGFTSSDNNLEWLGLTSSDNNLKKQAKKRL